MSDIPYPDTPQPDIPVLPEPDMPTPVPEVEPNPSEEPDLPPEPYDPPGDDVPTAARACLQRGSMRSLEFPFIERDTLRVDGPAVAAP
jgi:hypothetical protein